MQLIREPPRAPSPRTPRRSLRRAAIVEQLVFPISLSSQFHAHGFCLLLFHHFSHSRGSRNVWLVSFCKESIIEGAIVSKRRFASAPFGVLGSAAAPCALLRLFTNFSTIGLRTSSF